MGLFSAIILENEGFSLNDLNLMQRVALKKAYSGRLDPNKVSEKEAEILDTLVDFGLMDIGYELTEDGERAAKILDQYSKRERENLTLAKQLASSEKYDDLTSEDDYYYDDDDIIFTEAEKSALTITGLTEEELKNFFRPKLLRESNTYTLFWKTGDRNVVKGKTVEDAFTLAGFGAGAAGALDFWVRGNSNEYEFIDGKWIKNTLNEGDVVQFPTKKKNKDSQYTEKLQCFDCGKQFQRSYHKGRSSMKEVCPECGGEDIGYAKVKVNESKNKILKEVKVPISELSHLTHYYDLDDSDMVHGFEMGECENCGGQVEEANGVNIDLAGAQKMNLKRINTPPSQINVTDQGECFCDNCSVNADDNYKPHNFDDYGDYINSPEDNIMDEIKATSNAGDANTKWYEGADWDIKLKNKLNEVKEDKKIKLKCQECNNKFSRKNIKDEVKCPKCGGYDVDLLKENLDRIKNMSDEELKNSYFSVYREWEYGNQANHMPETGKWIDTLLSELEKEMDNRDIEHYNSPVDAEDWDDEHDQFMSDAEADADVLASAGYGTDEDYGVYDSGDENWFESVDWDIKLKKLLNENNKNKKILKENLQKQITKMADDDLKSIYYSLRTEWSNVPMIPITERFMDSIIWELEIEMGKRSIELNMPGHKSI